MPDLPETLTSFIDGGWEAADRERIISRENPGRLNELAVRWCAATTTAAGRARDGAVRAFPVWAAVPLAERVGLLRGWLQSVESRQEEFAALITRENGKPRRDARAEVVSGLADARHAIAEAETRGIVEDYSASGRVKGEQYQEPLGVCLLITPWNFPFATVLRKLVPALLYGNCAVVKPSELTPGPACLLFSVLAGLRLPPGVAQLVLGHGPEIGPALVAHLGLRAISFTGSTAVGENLSRSTAGRDVRLQLEMGGKNALVVMADADLDAAVEAAAVGAFTCSGQWCTGTGRVIVEQPVHDLFVEKLIQRLAPLRLGNGDDEATDLGPVITAQRVRFAASVVAEAVAAGARAHVAGVPAHDGHFVTPVVLDRVHEAMPLFLEELFIPVLPVLAARDATDAIRLANTGRYGLSASIYSQAGERAIGWARQIEAGIVHLNLHTGYREAALPVSGWRESGRGLPECGRFARDFYTRSRALYQLSP